MERNTRFTLAVTVVSGLALVSTVGHTAPLPFEFDIEFDFGPLSGRTFTGSFVVDDTALAGRPFTTGFTPAGTTGKLLSFEINIDGRLFTMEDDDSFPNRPYVEIFNETKKEVNAIFYNPSTFTAGTLSIDYDPFLFDDIFPTPMNFVNLDDNSGSIISTQVVPLPASVAFLATGLFGLVAAQRARRRSR